MNKWEESFKKTSDNSTTCYCSSNQGLFVPNRQLSFIIAGLLFLFFTIFMTGYFWGKKSALESFATQIEQDAFADQVYTSVIATSSIGLHSEQPEAHGTLLMTEAAIVETSSLGNEEVVVENVPQISCPRYYAQLIGFGTEKAAHLFVKKLASKGIDTEVKKRTSESAKGRISHWYQVVTNAYADKNELLQLVDRIAKEENIKDTNIRTC